MREPVLRVLTYHRVIDPVDAPTTDRSLISATPEVFDRQMRHLAAHYRVVSAEEVVAAVRSRRPLPERAVLVTFDDAYRDVGEIAWPILRRHGLPATVFVPTAYPDHPEREFWWDRLSRAFALTRRTVLRFPPLGALPLTPPELRRASLLALLEHLKRIPHAGVTATVERVCAALGDEGPRPAEVLGWDELRSLARDGVALGAHTRTHPALDRLPPEEARAEILGARDDLRREIGSVPPIFAYPFGAYDGRVLEAVREAGFEVALTCLFGHNPVPLRDPLRLRRTNITTRTSPLVFGVRLLALFSYVDRWRHRARRP